MAAQKEEDIQLPEKINNDNEFRPIGPVGVLINAFELNLKSAPEKVYQHELRFEVEFFKAGKNGKEQQLETRELARGPRNDESKETRRELHWALWQILLEQNAEFFGTRKNEFSYDCALLLYSIRRLMRNGETREFVITPESLVGLSERSRSYLRSGCERIKAFLMAMEEVEVRNVRVMEPGGDRSVCQFLELLSTQRMHDRNEHFVFGNRMFEKNSVVTLQGDPRICKDGMQKNVRFVGDNPNNSSAIIQLDAKKSAFFPAISVIDFVGRFINSSTNTIENDFSRPGTFRMINKQIIGLCVHTTHLAGNQMSFCASGLTDRSAGDLTLKENHEINLVYYYEQKYNRRLRYPRLPCVIHRRGSKESFFPMEVLQIIDGQRVTLDKQTPKLTEQMIRKCQVLPFELPRGIETQRDMGMIQNANPFFRAHEIRVETNMMQAEAHQLYPPALAFSGPNEQIEPNARGVLDFRLAERGQPIPRRYTVPCEFPKTWAVVIVQNVVRKEQCRLFCENLIRCAQARGVQMGMPPRVDEFDDISLEHVREQFSFFSKHRCQFVLFFAPGKESAHAGDVHHVFKLQEIEHGVLTQHVTPKIMEKATGRQGAIMVLDNIMLKMNLKMGGVNYDICAAQAFKQVNGLRHDIVSEQWLGGKRMFFGLDLSHAPPQTLFERRMGKTPAIPTIVGMAYTIASKHVLKLNGTYWMQQPRVTTVQMTAPMVNAVKEALITFSGLNGFFPEHIFVFRAGASEGEYKKVAYWEGGAFEAAFDELIKERKMAKRPFLTMIVCQRNSNYRIIPKNVQQGGRAPEQNCQPGTVLDKKAMHSSLTEFLLVGHRTIQGTAQPLRCTVVVDSAEPRIKLSELEQICYALCYQHGICCSPTAVPGVLYSAGDLATRGRNNWRTSTGDGDHIKQFDLPPQDQSDQVRTDMQTQLDDQRAQYFAQVTDELRPTIPTKFWA